MNKRLLLVGAFIATAVAVPSIALASIPDSSGTIHACYDNKTQIVSVIDDTNQACTSKQTALNWGQTGSQGPAGAVGPQGVKGDTGAAGAAGFANLYQKSQPFFLPGTSNGLFSLSCNPGDKVISGTATSTSGQPGGQEWPNWPDSPSSWTVGPGPAAGGVIYIVCVAP